MGRHRKHPLSNGKVAKKPSTGAVQVRDDVEKRIGLTRQICMKCNARNSERAERCRKCGHNQLRKKSAEYRDG